MKVAVVGAGWSGMAAAVEICSGGHNATVFEASRSIGGRARAIKGSLPDGTEVILDNGQHILIGAYSECLKLMRQVGVDDGKALLNLPLSLTFPDGTGLEFANLSAPFDALAGILSARGWSLRDKFSLVRASIRWQRLGFQCATQLTVAELCKDMTLRLREDMIEPLCVSALNTPASHASAQVFLRVIKDALFGASEGSRLLLPCVDLSTLFPQTACRWLQDHGGEVLTGNRILSLTQEGAQWQVNGHHFDAVILAASSTETANTLTLSSSIATDSIAKSMQNWVKTAQALQFEAIATVYTWAEGVSLSRPILSLRSHSGTAPAQFVFDRGQLGGPAGLLAFVVSASSTERSELEELVLDQARAQLGLDLRPVQTVVEKRATFSCTPGLKRPAQSVCPKVWAAGDYIEGPYPATLEGAVRNGQRAAHSVIDAFHGATPDRG